MSEPSLAEQRLAQLEALFWQWYSRQAHDIKGYLAWLYWTHTTIDANDLGVERDEAMRKFEHLFHSWDFLPRRCVRLLVIASVFDLFLSHVSGVPLGIFAEGGKVVDISRKQWEKCRREWRSVRHLFAEEVIGSCLEV